MKLILAAILSLFLINSSFGREKTPEKKDYAKALTTLNLSASSLYSYEDAMTRFSRMKPDGYVIESVKYYRQGSNYIVAVKLRKIS